MAISVDFKLPTTLVCPAVTRGAKLPFAEVIMKLPVLLLLTTLICLPILAQTANPQQTDAQPQQSAGTQATPGSSAPANSGQANAHGSWRKIKVKVVSPPEGATAQCQDRSYSFSQHVSGTCANHGGVKQWLKPVNLE
jgi:hypothetical protein